MFRVAAFFVAVASLVTAQTTTNSVDPSAATGVSGCVSQIDQIVSLCVSSQNSILRQCTPTDYTCLCTQAKEILTCYNNCPSDPNATGAQHTKDNYCNAAAAYAPSSSSAKSTASVSAPVAAAVSPTGDTVAAASTSPAAASTSTPAKGGADTFAPATRTMVALVGFTVIFAHFSVFILL